MKTPSAMLVVGARPQFVKLAPVLRALASHTRMRPECITVHTGQHYDEAMSGVFFSELGIPPPTANLGIGSGPHGQQTGRMLEALETCMAEYRPSIVVVFGDTNSTLAGAPAAAKMHIPVAHVEAGLRSFNSRMPEEINRVLTDHVSDLLFAPTQAAIENLAREGLADKARFTGDVMYDVVQQSLKEAHQRSRILERLRLKQNGYGLATVHRAENTEPQRLQALLQALNMAAEAHGPVVFPIHPRTRSVLKHSCDNWVPHDRLMIIDPLGYLDLLSLLQGAAFVATDSGGLQKEAVFLARPCFTLRDETEWIETVQLGANVLVGSTGAGLLDELSRLEATRHRVESRALQIASVYGEGVASTRIAALVCERLGSGV